MFDPSEGESGFVGPLWLVGEDVAHRVGGAPRRGVVVASRELTPNSLLRRCRASALAPPSLAH
jgi:hypothetical protein